MLQVWSNVYTCSGVCIDPLNLRQKEIYHIKCNQDSKTQKTASSMYDAYYMTEGDKSKQIISSVVLFAWSNVVFPYFTY